MSDLLKDLASKGTKILTDTKAPRKTVPQTKALPGVASDQVLDIHQAAVKKFVKDKPNKKHLLEFFEKVIEAEEKKL